MIKINSTTYIDFTDYVDFQMVWSGWEYKLYFGLFIIYKKSLLK